MLPPATKFQLPPIKIYGLVVINSNLPAKKNEVLDLVVEVGTVNQILMLDIVTYLLVVQKSFFEVIIAAAKLTLTSFFYSNIYIEPPYYIIASSNLLNYYFSKHIFVIIRKSIKY